MHIQVHKFITNITDFKMKHTNNVLTNSIKIMLLVRYINLSHKFHSVNFSLGNVFPTFAELLGLQPSEG